MPLIETTKGLVNSESMVHKSQVFKSDEAITTSSEYWLHGELVHRSLNVELIGRDLGAAQQPLG